ncbi:MAG: DUF4143 domain-containing protein, partial [Spirochaetales bacterium]|nr:DUF4143 domain-containing protein [Spirochaetales bacterium]
TYILNEFLKNCYNYGEKFELYFWRDNHKKEIDLIADFGQKQYGIEIKSGQTIQEKYFSGLKYWSNLTGKDTGLMYLIYGGNENYARNGMNVISWNNIYEGIIKKTI